MKRRSALLLAGATLVVPRLVLAQTARSYRLGWLLTTNEALTQPLHDAFLARMRELGYVAGKNLINDLRWAQGDASRYPALAEELIALKPDVLLGIQEAALVLRAKTSVIPIVLLSSSDPVRAGLVKSLARPGTNVTGMAALYDQLLAKQIELLIELVPKMSRVALLRDSSAPPPGYLDQVAKSAAAAKGRILVTDAAHDTEGIRRAFNEFSRQRAEAIVVAPTGPLGFLRHEIAREAARRRLPTIGGGYAVAEGGYLMSYSANLRDAFLNEVPTFVDQILRGAKPAELPVRQTTKYELVVNLKTARAIGLTIPRAILLRADRVIE